MIKALIFDKDGTLTDFTATWGAGARHIFDALVGDDTDRKRQLGAAIGFNWDEGTFVPGSVGVTGPETAVLERLAPLLPDYSRDALDITYYGAARQVVQRPVVELGPYFARLAAAGYRLGVVTNDAEAPARAHMQQHGVLAHLDFLAGFDSGHGAKPDPGPLLAFAAQTGVAPEDTLMIGDSHFDLQAARAAGMGAIGVLTGAASETELGALADAVLPDISHLPGWLARD
ncbi:MAG: HAD family hydrolase [Pseudomonadota bacterium]